MDENRTSREESRRDAPRRKPVRRRRRRRLGVVWALLYVAFVIGVSVLLATVGWMLANDVLALNKAEHSAEITLPQSAFTTREIEGEKDGDGDAVKKTVTEADMDYVADVLEENGLIEYKWVFKLFSKFSNGSTKISPGTYTLNTNMDYRAIISGLGTTSVSRATVTLTFTEGSTVDQIFAQMEEKGVATVEELQDTAANHDYAFSFLEDIELGDYRRLEGYLFPDTYQFYLNEEPRTAINKLLVNFDAKFDDDLREKVAESDYSIYEILTIASMIEKETDGNDRRTISSVIYNRLENPTAETAGFLNVDATILYATGGTEVDTEAVTPYNTYTNKGLPPGPIANPGMGAIRAAMNPEDTGYYYYVLNPETNRHEYSKTYAEHEKKVNQFAQMD